MMNDVGSKQIVIWETSAISNLAMLRDCDDLIAQMNIAHNHWIPSYIFDEIAATPASEKREQLLCVCRKLIGNSGRVLIAPFFLIEAAIRIFSEFGELDWEILLQTRPEFERAIDSGIFDDDLASVQQPQLQKGLLDAEVYFASARPLYERLFQSSLKNHCALDEIIAQARSTGLIESNVQYYCQSILGESVDLQYARRFTIAFPPIEAMICAFLMAHYHRNKPMPPRKPAGAIDLLAATYLPVCDKYVSDDREQQSVLRDVAKYCSHQAEVIWFSGVFRKQFSIRS
jgi:hypothetical protein